MRVIHLGDWAVRVEDADLDKCVISIDVAIGLMQLGAKAYYDARMRGEIAPDFLAALKTAAGE